MRQHTDSPDAASSGRRRPQLASATVLLLLLMLLSACGRGGTAPASSDVAATVAQAPEVTVYHAPT
ncbi:MAG: hypothetical protein ACRC1H_03725 [Caldilineaceae bacterium]